MPIPNVAKRHYLSGFNLRGEFIMFLLEASGGMLADTIDGAVTETGKPPEERREAEKWQRAVRSVKWMIGNLPPNARFQIYIFNAETKPLIESTKGQWIQPGNRKAVAEMVGKLDELVPSGPANLERAFSTIRFMDTIPDSLVLFTDGLPTTSDSMAVSGNVDADTRVRLFRLAQRQLPPRVPVNTILFPMEGDPAAAMLFWEMGVSTRGALVSPAKHWPET